LVLHIISNGVWDEVLGLEEHLQCMASSIISKWAVMSGSRFVALAPL
jgi:hypothetical protein